MVSQRRGQLLAAARVLLIAALVGACGQSPSKSTSKDTVLVPADVYAARTADNGTALVLDYGGGTCAGDPTPVPTATESDSPSTVTVQVLLPQPRRSNNTPCADLGLQGFVTLHLHRPLGQRKLIDKSFGKTITPFDGTGFLEPTWLPAGYSLRTDAGTPELWRQVWAPPPTTTNGRCVPHGQAIQFQEGYGIPQVQPPASVPAPVYYNVAGTVAQLNAGRLHWVPAGHPAGWEVALQSQVTCLGDTPVTIETLLHVANSLQGKKT